MRDVVASYIGGGWGKDSPDEEYVVPAFVVRGTDFSSIVEGDNRTVPARFHKKSNVSKRQFGIDDIVFEVSGGSKNQPVGRTVLAKDSVLAQFDAPVIPASFCKRVVIDKHVAVPAYVYYFLASIYQNRTITQWQTQSTGLSNFGFEKFLDECEVTLPPLPVQSRIASILSAYDELIENNQRRIRILETMARALYREWFVEFRFPGHERFPRVASPFGDIPQGWEVKKVGDIAENIRRNVPKGALDVPRPYVGLEHIPRRSLALDAWEMTTELGSNKLEFRKGEVIFGKIRPYFHKVSVSPFDGVCSADTIVIRARRPEDYAFMVACVSSDAFVAHASATANGSKMPRANWNVLENYEVVIPQGEVIRHFSALLVGILAQEQTLMFQIHNLRRTRDLLLPRLLSGQVALTETAA